MKWFTSDGANEHLSSFAALPPDVRKGCAFPTTLSQAFWRLRLRIRGVASEDDSALFGRAEPFRTSDGRAASRQRIQNLIDPLWRQLLVIVKINLKHRRRSA